MKAAALILFALFSTLAYADDFRYITVDTTWHTVRLDSLNQGDETSVHDWINGPMYVPGFPSNRQLAPGQHDINLDPFRERICAKCLRHEIQRGNINQKQEAVKPSFSKLKSQLKKSP